MPTIDPATKEITWSYEERRAELQRLGLANYPTADDFTEDEITDAIDRLSSYYLVKEVAVYNGESFTAQQVKTWAAFADTLGKDVHISVTSGGFKITRDTSPVERRESAVSDLAGKKNTANDKLARRELTRRYREENTDASGYTYDNGLTE